jgi:hypothetical protein
MANFTVTVPEHWDRVYRRVEADTLEGAIQIVREWEADGDDRVSEAPVEFVETIDGRDISASIFAEAE